MIVNVLNTPVEIKRLSNGIKMHDINIKTTLTISI